MDKSNLRAEIKATLQDLFDGKVDVKSATNLIMFKVLLAEGEAEPTLTVPDIRNKLTPVTTLVSLIERNEPEFVQAVLPQVKLSVNYLAQREVYTKNEDDDNIPN